MRGSVFITEAFLPNVRIGAAMPSILAATLIGVRLCFFSPAPVSAGTPNMYRTYRGWGIPNMHQTYRGWEVWSSAFRGCALPGSLTFYTQDGKVGFRAESNLGTRHSGPPSLGRPGVCWGYTRARAQMRRSTEGLRAQALMVHFHF